MTTTEPTTEEAFWLAIGAAPEDKLPRLVFADWLEERSSLIVCHACGGEGGWQDDGEYQSSWWVHCPSCAGKPHHIPDRNGRLAAALRATAAYWPMTESDCDGTFVNGREIGDSFWWYRGNLDGSPEQGVIPEQLYDGISGKGGHWRASSSNWLFPTAAAAILALCEAWMRVTYGEVTT